MGSIRHRPSHGLIARTLITAAVVLAVPIVAAQVRPGPPPGSAQDRPQAGDPVGRALGGEGHNRLGGPGSQRAELVPPPTPPRALPPRPPEAGSFASLAAAMVTAANPISLNDPDLHNTLQEPNPR